MDQRFFITEIYAPSGTRTLEKQLADYLRKYVDHVVSASALERIADELQAEQDRILSANRRLSPVQIFQDLDGKYGFYSFHAGQVSVNLRRVNGEII